MTDYFDNYFFTSNLTDYVCPGFGDFQCKPPNACARDPNTGKRYCCDQADVCWSITATCSSDGSTIDCGSGDSTWCCLDGTESCTQTSNQINICWNTAHDTLTNISATQLNDTFSSLSSASPSASSFIFTPITLIAATQTSSSTTSTTSSTTTSTNSSSSSSGSSTSVSPTSTAAAPSQGSSTSISNGAIAGIAIGVLIALSLVVAAVFFLLRRQRQRRRESGPHQLPLQDEASTTTAGKQQENYYYSGRWNAPPVEMADTTGGAGGRASELAPEGRMVDAVELPGETYH